MNTIAGAQAGTCIAMPISGILADNLGWESVFYFLVLLVSFGSFFGPTFATIHQQVILAFLRLLLYF